MAEARLTPGPRRFTKNLKWKERRTLSKPYVLRTCFRKKYVRYGKQFGNRNSNWSASSCWRFQATEYRTRVRSIKDADAIVVLWGRVTMAIIQFAEVRELLSLLRNREEAGMVCSIVACSFEIHACLQLIRATKQHADIIQDLLVASTSASHSVSTTPMLLELTNRMEHQVFPTFARLRACLLKFYRLQVFLEAAISQHKSIIEELQQVSNTNTE